MVVSIETSFWLLFWLAESQTERERERARAAVRQLAANSSRGPRGRLASETVESAALALEGVDDVHGGDGLAAGVLGVGDGVTDDVLEEDLEDTAGLFIDHAGDALDTTTASQTADGGLGDALDVVAKNLAVTLGAALAQSLTSLATTRHVVLVLFLFLSKCEAMSPNFFTLAAEPTPTRSPGFWGGRPCKGQSV